MVTMRAKHCPARHSQSHKLISFSCLLRQYSAAPRTESQRQAIRSLAATHTWGYHPARSMVTAPEPRLREMVAPLVEFGFSQLEDI